MFSKRGNTVIKLFCRRYFFQAFKTNNPEFNVIV